MMQLFVALLAGLIFGVGLILSGMTNPDNIQNFLDITGNWDPALLFVMVGAIMVSAVAFFWIKKSETSLLGEPVQLPSNKLVDTKLIAGATFFGIGWGLIGFCPGPAIAALITQPEQASLFLVSMVAGMIIFKMVKRN